jgi:hypothetical protein
MYTEYEGLGWIKHVVAIKEIFFQAIKFDLCKLQNNKKDLCDYSNCI